MSLRLREMKDRLMRILYVLAVLSLSACVSAEEWARRDHEACLGYGFKAGTEAYSNCLMQTAQAREADRGRRAQAAAAWYNATRASQ